MKNNETTAKLVKKYVSDNPFLTDFLQRDVINIASLARELLPKIKKENKKATVESISVAIQRLDTKKSVISTLLQKIAGDVQITTRTDVMLFCLPKTKDVVDTSKLRGDDTFFMNAGADEVTVIIDKRNKGLIKNKPLFQKDDLALITLKDVHFGEAQNYRTTPGFVHLFLSNISKEGVNVEDILSTRSQLTFVVEKKHLLRVFSICERVKQMRYY